jgi:hypothetical protein
MLNVVTCISSATQRLAKHLYKVTQSIVQAPLQMSNKRLPRIREVKPLEEVISTRFAEGYKRRPDETKRQSELEN